MTLSPSLRAFVFGIGSGLVGYFFVEKDSTTLGMDSVVFAWMLLSILALLDSFVLRRISDEPAAGKTALLVWVGILTGVMGHIIYDGAFTEQTHNLFPFELAFISLFVLPAALIGAFGANLLRRSRAQEG